MKTIEEKILVMQAFADGKAVEFLCTNDNGKSEWVGVGEPEWNWTKYDYRVKQDIPRTWNDFCKRNDEITNEYYVDYDSNVCRIECQHYRGVEQDANMIATKDDAEGLLALIKLKRLRDAWWGNWRPDYNSGIVKHCVQKDHYSCPDGSIEICNTNRCESFLIFPTKEMAKDFLECFRDLIEQAEMWL